MPELPDVEIYRRYLDATSLHKTIHEVEIPAPAVLGEASAQDVQEALIDRQFQATRRHGKYLFIELGEGLVLVFHFGMTGFLRYYKDPTDAPPHTRLLIGFIDGYHLAYDSRRKLGRVDLSGSVDEFVKARGLGPDALAIDRAEFEELLTGRRGTVKSTLMDQHSLAGIGNIYSDEILFQTHIHPVTQVQQLDDGYQEKVYTTMRNVLIKAIELGADPDRFPDTWLIPHRREGEACPKCDGTVQTMKISGRTSYFCPSCQRKVS